MACWNSICTGDQEVCNEGMAPYADSTILAKGREIHQQGNMIPGREHVQREDKFVGNGKSALIFWIVVSPNAHFPSDHVVKGPVFKPCVGFSPLAKRLWGVSSNPESESESESRWHAYSLSTQPFFFVPCVRAPRVVVHHFTFVKSLAKGVARGHRESVR